VTIYALQGDIFLENLNKDKASNDLAFFFAFSLLKKKRLVEILIKKKIGRDNSDAQFFTNQLILLAFSEEPSKKIRMDRFSHYY
jgi:hypothetical protein